MSAQTTIDIGNMINTVADCVDALGDSATELDTVIGTLQNSCDEAKTKFDQITVVTPWPFFVNW